MGFTHNEPQISQMNQAIGRGRVQDLQLEFYSPEEDGIFIWECPNVELEDVDEIFQRGGRCLEQGDKVTLLLGKNLQGQFESVRTWYFPEKEAV